MSLKKCVIQQILGVPVHAVYKLMWNTHVDADVEGIYEVCWLGLLFRPILFVIYAYVCYHRSVGLVCMAMSLCTEEVCRKWTV